MIKVYCDECGKEITGAAHKVIEKIEATDALGAVLVTFPKEIHLCDECQYNDFTCGFKVGDQVITSDGRVGVIEGICDCEYCKERGFYEPKVKMTIGNDQIWIADTDKENGFIRFYKIGNQVFGNVNKEAIEDIRENITDVRHELIEYESQLNVLLDLTNNRRK